MPSPICHMPKKLIEVALPLDAINAASAREKSIRHGHPSTLHLWWARRPLAAARAVIFAQMVDDPSSWPDLFPTEAAQEAERQRLFRLIEQLVQWENTTNEEVLQQARDEIWKSWRRTCAAERQEIEKRKEEREERERERLLALFNPDTLPAFHDPFAGGGALPLEAQRLGLEAYASDLNPVAVLINKAMIEIPPRFAGMPPVSLGNRSEEIGNRSEEGSGLDSSEHRRGLGAGVGSGEGTVSGHSAGITGRTRNAADALHPDWLVSGRGDSAAAGIDGRNGADAHHNATPAKGGVGNRAEETGNSTALQQTSISSFLSPVSYKGAAGLAADVRSYGQWMRDEAEKRIGHLYPKIEVTAEMVRERPDLTPYLGQKLTVIAWLWARTVKSPNPAFAHVDVPLASTFMLSTKPGKEAWVEPVIEPGRAGVPPAYRFNVRTRAGHGAPPPEAKDGAKLARGARFRCIMSGAVINDPYIKAESMAGRMGARLMAIVAEGERGRIYLPPTAEHEAIARSARPAWKPDQEMNRETSVLVSGRGYGFFTWADLFTPRQLVALTTFADLVQEARARVKADYLRGRSARPSSEDDVPLAAGGAGAQAYADAVAVYLAFAVDKCADYWSTVCSWNVSREGIGHTFVRQAIPMVWDYAEANPLCDSTGNWMAMVGWVWEALTTLPATLIGSSYQSDVQKLAQTKPVIISTDPPYYDNIDYADLSDFFYVWLRRSLRDVFPDLFATMAVPKAEELVATPYRHGSKENAERFFLEGMTKALRRLAEQSHPAFPVTIYYAFKQSETDKTDGTSSTGWETFLDAVIRSGFAITGTWPTRTERESRSVSLGTNALASSIVLVCRPRPQNAPTVTRRDFVAALKSEVPAALRAMQRGNIAPVDLAQAAIGPGMAVYTRYGKVIDASGKPLSVREALALINQALDETLAEQEGDFDADTRWALAWFDQHGFAEGEYGVAEILSKAKNTSVGGMVEAGLLVARGGKVRLLRPDELPADWNPAADGRLTVWKMTHYLVRTLEQGEVRAAELLAQLGAQADVARELAYRLYTICERKKRAAEALAYNSLVQSWPEMARLAQQRRSGVVEQQGMDLQAKE